MRMKGKRYCSADATGVYAAFSFLSLSFLAVGLCPHWSVTTIGCGDISFFRWTKNSGSSVALSSFR